MPKPPSPRALRILHIPKEYVTGASDCPAVTEFEKLLAEEYDLFTVTPDPGGNGWHYHMVLWPEGDEEDDDE